MCNELKIRQYAVGDKEGVIALWRQCGLVVAWNNPADDIARKLVVGSDLFLVGERAGEIVATVMGGYEGHRGWINYLAVSPRFRRLGYGRSVMAEVERRILEKGCPKINLQVRSSNLDVIRFYKSLGFAVDDVVSLGKRLVED